MMFLHKMHVLLGVKKFEDLEGDRGEGVEEDEWDEIEESKRGEVTLSSLQNAQNTPFADGA